MSSVDALTPPWGEVLSILSNGPPDSPGPAGSGDATAREEWQAVIDTYLREWAKDPQVLEDDGLVPPSAETIRLACQVAEILGKAGVPAPHRVAATGDGGIVFAYQAGSLLTTLEVVADGAVEFALFRDARLVSRQRLPGTSPTAP